MNLSKLPSDGKKAAGRNREAAHLEAAPLATSGQGMIRAPTMALGPGVRSVKQEILHMEEAIPWTYVKRAWRNKRTSWRRQVKATELVTDLALRLRELRNALLLDEGFFTGCGRTWHNQLEVCIDGRGSAAVLLSLWDEMKNAIASWLGRPEIFSDGLISFAQSGPPPSNESTARAIQALQAAVKDKSCTVESLVQQVPLELIVGHDSASLDAVAQAIEAERRYINSKLAAFQGTESPNYVGNVATSYFSSIGAPWDLISDDGQESNDTNLEMDFSTAY
jgi:hypothetical protein